MNESPARVEVRDTLEAMSRAAAEHLLQLAHAAVAARGVFTLALTGGTTPVPLYTLLAAPPWRDRMPWASTQVYWGDERCVPPRHAESNYGLAWRLLLAGLALPPAHIHRIAGEDPEPARAAAHYAQQLPDALDLLLLGIGEDGHLASLFPGSPLLREHVLRVAAVTDAPKPPPCRITITPPVIHAARQLLVLAAGVAKADAVARALTGADEVSRTPAQLARRGQWYLDAPAASALKR